MLKFGVLLSFGILKVVTNAGLFGGGGGIREPKNVQKYHVILVVTIDLEEGVNPQFLLVYPQKQTTNSWREYDPWKEMVP